MSKRRTAEQVAACLEEFGFAEDSELARDAYHESAAVVREHLIETDEQRRERFELWVRVKWSHLPAGAMKKMLRVIDDVYDEPWVEDRYVTFKAGAIWHGEAEGGGE